MMLTLDCYKINLSCDIIGQILLSLHLVSITATMHTEKQVEMDEQMLTG